MSCIDIHFTQTGERAFEAPCAGWPEDAWLLVEMRVRQATLVRATFAFHARGAGEPACTVYQRLFPGVRIRAGFPLSVLSGASTFLPPQPGQYKSGVHGRPSGLSSMERVTLTFSPDDATETIELFGAWVTDTPAFPVAGDIMVDEMGQIAGKGWPGKQRDPEALSLALRRERERAHAAYPDGFSPWGGWLAKRFDATGWFHTHHDGRRWWLVDPDGYAFLSHGMCYGNRMGIYTMTSGNESLCAWLPEREDPLYGQAYMAASRDPEFKKRNGEAAGADRWMFNFARANMMRAFGADWWDAWADLYSARLKSWGVNTLGIGVGNYPDERTMDFVQRVRIPYVWSLTDFPKPAACVYRDFPDVFSEEYRVLSEAYARQLAPMRDDPLLIGYFLTNEPEWLFQADVCLSERLLASEIPFTSKRVLIGRLRGQYGDIDALNAGWRTSLSSFDDLLKPILRADLLSEQAMTDLEAFDAELIAAYARVPSDALRAVAPHHLNLGMRYASFRPKAVSGFRHYDVFSFNCYQETCAEWAEMARDLSGLPLMVGEWHVAAMDRGLLGSGLLQAVGQTDRAKAMQYYLEQGFADPSVVGLHYFELFDQPPLGRFDGATGQSGLVDICNMPYPECDAALRAFAGRMYPIADGRTPPTETRGALEPKVY